VRDADHDEKYRLSFAIVATRRIRLKKLDLRQLLVLNAYWVGLSFMWNAIHPILLPAVLLNYVPDARKNTYLGLLTFVGLIIAMVALRWSSSRSQVLSLTAGNRALGAGVHSR
jgi:hypothetical protein